MDNSNPKKPRYGEGNSDEDHWKRTRYCTECGNKIHGFAVEKTSICPHGFCKAPVPLRNLKPFVFEKGVALCPVCSCYIREEDNYCMVCRNINTYALQKKKRLAEKKRLEEEFQRQTYIDGMKKELQSKDNYSVKRLKQMVMATLGPDALKDIKADNPGKEGTSKIPLPSTSSEEMEVCVLSSPEDGKQAIVEPFVTVQEDLSCEEANKKVKLPSNKATSSKKKKGEKPN